MLAGCSIFNERSLLGLEVPEQYRSTQSLSPTPPPALDWWRGFRSRELTALIEEAQTANFDVAAAVAKIIQADAQSKIAGAPLLPSADLDASVTRSRPAGGPDRTTWRTAITASYEIDFWGKNRAAQLFSEENAVAARYAREVVALTTMATVANTYFRALGAKDSLLIARENVASASRVLGVIRERFQAGTASRHDIVHQESLVAIQRATIPPLQITLEQSIAQLAVLIGRAPEHITLRSGGSAGIRVPTITPGLPSDILRQRPDIRQAEAQLAASNYSVESARAAFFPNIALTGQRGFQSAVLASLFGPGAWYYTMAASLTQPVFDGFLRQGQLELAQGQQQEFLADYRKAVLSAFSDVEQALIAVQQQATRERLQADAVRAAREAFELSEQRLREGTVDLITVLTTQQTLFQAQDTLAQIRFARLQAAVNLFQALGGGWPPADINLPVSQ
jgi:NodT family efflux transporter outer membrane factor (OMF) lipoprotein